MREIGDLNARPSRSPCLIVHRCHAAEIDRAILAELAFACAHAPDRIDGRLFRLSAGSKPAGGW